jgi:hypothetical protein
MRVFLSTEVFPNRGELYMPSDGRLLMWDSLTLSIIMIDKPKESHMISQPPPKAMYTFVRQWRVQSVCVFFLDVYAWLLILLLRHDGETDGVWHVHYACFWYVVLSRAVRRRCNKKRLGFAVCGVHFLHLRLFRCRAIQCTRSQLASRQAIV